MKLRYKLRALLPLDSKRVAILEQYNWYRNMTGGWTHPHCLDFMSRVEIVSLSLEELEQAMMHGSRSVIHEDSEPYFDPNLP